MIVLTIMFLMPTADAADITRSGNIADGYHIANPGNIEIEEDATVVTGRTVLCVATGTMTFGTGFTVESGSVFGAFSGTPSEIADSIDYDSDGMPDYWEYTYFSSLDEDASGDYDGDGYMNILEYEKSANPDNSASTPDPELTYEYDEMGRITKITRVH
jgi:hypothetical protein